MQMDPAHRPRGKHVCPRRCPGFQDCPAPTKAKRMLFYHPWTKAAAADAEKKKEDKKAAKVADEARVRRICSCCVL